MMQTQQLVIDFARAQGERAAQACIEKAQRVAAPAFKEKATQAILNRDGPAALTTPAIAAESGVSVGSIYQYFPDALAAAMKLPHETYRTDRAAVLARFDWDAVAAQTLQVYERVIGEGDAPAPVRALA